MDEEFDKETMKLNNESFEKEISLQSDPWFEQVKYGVPFDAFLKDPVPMPATDINKEPVHIPTNGENIEPSNIEVKQI